MDYKSQLEKLVNDALLEDVGEGDHSTLSCIDAAARGKAVLKIKQDGVLAGVEAARSIFNIVEPGCDFIIFKSDGESMVFGDIAFEVHASVHNILKCERLVLNTMQRMSGIATLTAQYTRKLKNYRSKLLDTRKTTPNFRLLEKEAVRIGGGMNHRFGLYDMIMLKDNHIDYCGGITKAVGKAYDYVRSNNLKLKIEVETRSLDDVRETLATGKVNRIMLDNFSPALIGDAMAIINGQVETEASGGINLDNIEEYANAGVDFISSGSIIHQAVNLDLSLKAIII